MAQLTQQVYRKANFVGFNVQVSFLVVPDSWHPTLRMKLDVFAKILNLQSVIPGLTRNPVLSFCSGCRIRSGMTNKDLLRDNQNYITQSLFFDQTGRSSGQRRGWTLKPEPLNLLYETSWNPGPLSYKIDRIHYSMLDVRCSMFDVHPFLRFGIF